MNLIGGNFDTIPTKVVPVTSIGDFPPAVAGVITLEEDVVYRIDAQIITSNRFIIPDGSVSVFESTNNAVNSFIYTGTDTWFTSAAGSTSGRLDFRNIIVVGNSSATLMDLDGQEFDCFRATIAFFGDLGVTRNHPTAGMRLRFCGIFFNGAGFKIINSQLALALQTTFQNTVDTNLPLITIIGSSTIVAVDSNLMFRQTNESAFYIDPNFDVDDNTDIETILSGGGVGAGFFKPGTTASITAFADSSTSPGVKTTVTSATHGLINNEAVAITGTTSYNGTSLITDVTTNTFDIEVVFVADDATGTWDSSSIDQTDIRIKSDNVQGNDDSTSFANAVLNTPQTVTIASANVAVAVNGVNWQGAALDEEFTVSVAGVITYIGLKTRIFNLDGRLTLVKSGGGSDFIDAGFRVNGTDLLIDFVGSENNTSTQISPLSTVRLSTGDEVETAVRNVDNANDIDVLKAVVVVYKV